MEPAEAGCILSGIKKLFAVWIGYILLTFILGLVWHLVLFEQTYKDLGVYAHLDNPNFALGITSMVIQGGLLAYLFPRFHPGHNPRKEALIFSVLMGLFFGSGTVIAEVAKQNVSSLPLWFLMAGGFTLLHFTLVGLLIGWVYRKG